MKLMKRLAVSLAAMTVGASMLAAPAGADGSIDLSNNGEEATGTASNTTSGSKGSKGSGSGGPNCTKSDGTRDYYNYEGLQFTTMEEQRNEIRPEEQRPGVYLHTYCGDERLGFFFYPDAEPVDPTLLAQSVTITPQPPTVRTSPAAGSHLVNLESWFWTDEAQTLSQTASAGPVAVTVSASPREMVVDPGDGSGAFTCTTPGTAYDTNRPAEGQSSDCTHTYTKAGTFTATVTVVYDVSFTSTFAGLAGISGDLGTIEPDGSATVTVHESQALVTRG